MGPIVKECTESYADKSIEFVTFDFTTEESKAAAETTAKELGVEEVYAEHAPKTGMVILYDTRAKKSVHTLSPSEDSEEWHAAIDSALGEG